VCSSDLHKVRINNSNIKSGIIRRAFISNSTIYSETFDNADYLFSDKVTTIHGKEKLILLHFTRISTFFGITHEGLSQVNMIQSCQISLKI
jgi:hypothetical protein